MELLFNTINNVLGNGVNVLSLTGEGREADESSFTPIKDLNVPYHLFSMVDICDTTKEITIEERVIVYYKYDNHPVNCVKIFRSAFRAKPFGFRYVQPLFCVRENTIFENAMKTRELTSLIFQAFAIQSLQLHRQARPCRRYNTLRRRHLQYHHQADWPFGS